MAATAAQQKYSNLRRRLDQMGYKQPVGIESVPLIESLFSDLLHTTDSLKRAKLDASRRTGLSSNVEGDAGGSAAQIAAYRSDNAKLIKENTAVHQELIRVQEQLEFANKDLKVAMRNLEHENADLKFLNNQYVHRMRALEAESKQKSDRILQLQEKNFHAVVQTPGGKRKNVPFRRQRMDVDCLVPPPDSIAPPTPCQADDLYLADLLKVADDNVARLRQEVKNAVDDRVGLEAKVVNMRKQVDSRDAEITRLTTLLEGGRPHDVVALDAKYRTNERTISHLNIQIDYLQQKNQELQDQLNSAASRERELRLRAEEDSDKDDTRTRSKQDNAVEDLKAELKLQKSTCRRLTEKLDAEELSRQHLTDQLKILSEENDSLCQRVEKILTTERDLVLELDRVSGRGTRKTTGHTISSRSHSGVAKSSTTTSVIDAFMKHVEEERDLWKTEVDTLKRKIEASKAFGHQKRPGTSDPVITADNTRPVGPEDDRTKTSRPTSPVDSSAPDKMTCVRYERIISALKDERELHVRECETLKRECDMLRESLSKSASTQSNSNMKHHIEEGGDGSAHRVGPSGDGSNINMQRNQNTEEMRLELDGVRRERNELQKMLDTFEGHISEIEAKVGVLTRERDDISGLYDEVKTELARVRREAVRSSPRSAKTSLAAQAVLRRVENERDSIIAQLRNMTAERDTLKDRLKIATDIQMSDRVRLEQNVEDLENTLRSVETDRGGLEERIRLTSDYVKDLEKRLKVTTDQLTDAQTEATQQKAKATQMKVLADQADRALKDQLICLSRRDADLHASEDHIRALEEQLISVKRAAQCDRDEASKLRSTVAALDREKDMLQSAVDEKTEAEVNAEEDRSKKDRMIQELRSSVGDLEAMINRLKDSVAVKEKELSSLRRQVDVTSEQLVEASRGRDVALRENRRLQDDLATMTHENQAINQELNEALREKESAKRQAQEYIVEVKRCEELLITKDQERADVLEQYQILSQEAERFETTAHYLESETSERKLELLTREGEIRRLRDKLDQCERLIQEHVNTVHSYEVELSNLTKTVSHLNSTLKEREDEKQRVLQDLAAVRDLCTRLETTKDATQRQVVTKSLELEKHQAMLSEVTHECDALRAQLSSERTAKLNLEGLLNENRSKDWRNQMTVQEKDAEIELLRGRLTSNDSKIEGQAKELNIHRTKTAELESDLERAKRQLISERFERERAIQELRRHGLSLPGEGTLLGSISPNSDRSRSPGRSTSATT